MLKNKELTYISLFSSAGVGCYGFQEENYHCIATNEIIERRLQVQKFNHKCEFDSGYIAGDLTKLDIKEKIYEEMNKWKKRGNDRVDVIIATPPCQGISLINHKKNDKDLNRNSLVIESIEIIKKIKPRVFVFENVKGFQETFCITKDDKAFRIGDYIRKILGKDYIITGRVLNFMNYGANSSRTRTLVVGIDREYRNIFTPYDVFPKFQPEKNLRMVIGDFPPLSWGEICPNDFYHAFRVYDERMRPWIHDLKEGECAFNNEDPLKRPHRIINGKFVENVQKSRDKYTRQRWDRFVQCVHTRNDQLAAQNTVHPVEDRVFSIRELMEMMNVPKIFKWVDKSLEELNNLSLKDKRAVYKANEMNIRQCLGEAVPTVIMQQIAANISKELEHRKVGSVAINKFISKYSLNSKEMLENFITENPEHLALPELQRIVELCNAKRDENAAYYTNKFIVNEIMDILPDFKKDTIHVIEPSVGAGNFIPFLIKRYEDKTSVIIDVVDIDGFSINTLNLLLKYINIPDNFKINIINDDFLTMRTPKCYDLAIGNPPYSKIKQPSHELKAVLMKNINKVTKNLSEIFLEKCLRIADCTALVLNKTLLSSSEFDSTRNLLRKMRISNIIDFGRYGFTGLSIETMCIMIWPKLRPKDTLVYNMKYNFRMRQQQAKITDEKFPYFLIYRNDDFDKVANELQFGVFNVVRDRQITKKNTTQIPKPGFIRVIKARNIKDDGTIENIQGYDTYIAPDICEKLSISRYLNDVSIYLTPNMTYNPRVIRNVPNTIPDGSVAVLIPKEKIHLSQEQLNFFSSDEYRKFYKIARNLSTQSINVDANSVFFYGVKK
ncbi:DNA (cytosine-5-)-methyltransferase [Selenomonas sp. WCA-380-WT-3B 3/]|uniref:DNA (cytosine-5-)-methyltransferase n=1 Tax=Selenomonas montiformis TaxID=2652285 RepID=A0A6I2UZD8_9FIRM|nr:DNA cytosine methyltransferase [Selenomonas montiformis]MSV24646.1 DNA (cytosine-5-)-methyltransferase [Selenomonas montiformis]